MRTGRLLILAATAMLSASAAQAQHFIEHRAPTARYLDARGVSLDQAVEMAQRRYSARAIKAETVEQGGRRIHKIRLLSADGQVRNVRVDAQTGAMD